MIVKLGLIAKSDVYTGVRGCRMVCYQLLFVG